LGLTICEAFIKAHGGVIEGHNRIDGQGAEFTFTLPMEVAHHGEQE
jgi:two-component system sensor histidine kinase KdpD